MTKFEEFMKRQPKGSIPLGETVGGEFQCQLCHVYVEEADYFHREKLLVWRCPEEHQSFIEDFHL